MKFLSPAICRLQENCDVTAFYTNVSNEESVQPVSEMLDQHETEIMTFVLSKVHIMALIKECLNNNNIFPGQVLAGLCFVRRIGRPVIACMIIMNCRRLLRDCIVAFTPRKPAHSEAVERAVNRDINTTTTVVCACPLCTAGTR
uniref:DNA helicase n=1 Tax=Haemonchus contortus TaxID=6289 RepID=A0A7I4YNE1_HAECO